MRHIVVSAVFCCLSFISCVKNGGPVTGDGYTDLSNSRFEDLHSPAGEFKHLFLGGIGHPKKISHLPPALQKFSGRWEGYRLNTPVKNDVFLVVVFTDITEKDATVVMSIGLDTLKPYMIEKRKFTVAVVNDRYELQSTAVIKSLDNKGTVSAALSFWMEGDVLFHRSASPSDIKEHAAYTLTGNTRLTVVKDKRAELARHRITIETHTNREIARSSDGYMLYLPDGYEESAGKKWPVLLFYHGSGDSGDDPAVLYKASPFRYVLDKEGLPFIIAAPHLNGSQFYFPKEAFALFLDELREKYSIDAERVSVTGLSLGGYAVWQWAELFPERIAAFAPLSCSLPSVNARIAPGKNKLQGKPFWIVNGAKDVVFPIEQARENARDARAAGLAVRFSEMAEADHDTWTTTYGDRLFYDWLLSHKLK